MAPFESPRFNLDAAAHFGSKSPTRSYSSLQSLYLHRLGKLLRDRQEWGRRLGTDDWRLRLLNKAIYSTFCDCVEQGVAEDARSLFTQNRTSQRG
jgi:hypothetical protein